MAGEAEALTAWKEAPGMQISEVMTRSVITAPPGMSLTLAQRLMDDHRIRHLPVVQDERLLGLVSDRDVRQALPSLATTLSQAEILYKLGTIAVATCMSRDVATIAPRTDIARGTRQFLDGLYGCLPVVSKGQLVGIVTASDLLRGFLMDLGPAAARLLVRDHMRYAPMTGRPDHLVQHAQHRMHSADIRHLPVVTEDGKLLGILTDRDVRRAGASTVPPLTAYEAPLQLITMTIQDIMTTTLYTVSRVSTLADAGQLFLEHKIGCLPVVESDHTLAGIITMTDLLRAYVDFKRDSADFLA
jgi:CBS domain-containing protein